jgi:zinc protease
MTPHLKKTAPPPLAPISFDIPRPFETALDNGLRVVVFEDDRLPLVSYRLAFQRGDIHDPAGATGVTSAMAAMLTEGTENYTSRQLAEKIERLGASLGATSSDDFVIISASSLSLYGSEVLHLMSEVIGRPTFPESELDLYRRNTLEHLKFQRSQAAFLAGEQAARLVYGEHPYSVVSPKPADVEALRRERLNAFHMETFVPNNALLVIVGAVERDELMREIDDALGQWQPGDVNPRNFPSPPKRTSRSLTLVDRPGCH